MKTRTARTYLQWALALPLALAFQAASYAGPLTPLSLPDEPLFLSSSVPPNVFFELDDSGSMDWETMVPSNYRACRYDYSHPDTTCSLGLETSGNLVALVWRYYSGTWYRVWRSIEYQYGDGSSGDNGNYPYYYLDGYGDTLEFYEYGGSYVSDLDWRVYAYDFNRMGFNPAVTYEPWSGLGLSDASFTSAPAHPISGEPGASETRDLSGLRFTVWLDSAGWDTADDRPYPAGTSNVNYVATPNGMVDIWDEHVDFTIVDASTVTATYYTYAPDSSGLNESTTTQTWTGGSTTVCEDFDGDGNTDGPCATIDELVQNAANWYTYYRRRSFAAKAAVSNVVDTSPDLRYGLGFINYASNNNTWTNVPSGSGPFTSHNSTLLQTLAESETDGGTPLRAGFKDVVDYFNIGAATYDATSNPDVPIEWECQHNFAVLMTDGHYANNENVSTTGLQGCTSNDCDGDGTTYKLSDLAYAAGRNNPNVDLATSLVDDVPVERDDGTKVDYPQHLTTFSVSFGVDGALTDTDGDGWPDALAASGAAFSPAITADNDDTGDASVIQSAFWLANRINEAGAQEQAEKIDDLWHAAYNSSGEFISASDPDELVEGLEAVMEAVDSQRSASASLASTSGRTASTTSLYQAAFYPDTWHGELKELTYDPDNGVWEEGWTTNTTFNASPTRDDNRTVITYNPTVEFGAAFTEPVDYRNPSVTISGGDVVDAEIDDDQVDALLADAPYPSATNATDVAINQQYLADLFDYLRGDNTHNESGTAVSYTGSSSSGSYQFREREELLGDIVGSSPIWVGGPSQNFPETIESASYADYKADYGGRDEMVYVGANDGMLHAFDALTGEEAFAYVPSPVYENLPELADPNYSHHWYVDGRLNFMDVFDTTVPGFSAGGWGTILVGSLGKGGQGIFALNVTDPSDFDESNAGEMVLWEYTDADDADLGYVLGNMPIVKANNGDWVVLVPNGYSNTESDGTASTTGTASLLILNATTGALVKKLDTGAVGTTTANGLSGVTAVDVDGNHTADYAYAGDLEGNLWKFDLTDASENNWEIDNDEAYFTTDNGQPITATPALSGHPQGGVMILFGTGKYVETSDDIAAIPDQALYGVWDRLSTKNRNAPYDTSDLVEQTLTEVVTTVEGSSESKTLRFVTDNEPDYSGNNPDLGWYLPLVSTINGDQDERSVSTPTVFYGGKHVIFTTLIPDDNPCHHGGTGWVMLLETLTGSDPETFEGGLDLNGDGVVTVADSNYGDDSYDGEGAAGVLNEGGLLSEAGGNMTSLETGDDDGNSCNPEQFNDQSSSGDIMSISLDSLCALGRISWRILN